MGRFSTTLHIKNNIDRSGFVNAFGEIMKNRGFLPCSEDEAGVSYALAFGEGSWVTLTNEDYNRNPQKAHEDSLQIAEAMKTSAFSVEVVDSDFAVLILNNGDMVIVGDGSGYSIEEPSRGNPKYWQPLIASDRTWGQFSETVEQENIFVEETLLELAEILGIPPELICIDFDEISEIENPIRLYFIKA